MRNGQQPLIHLDGVSKVFYTEEVETHALNGIHLEIGQGEFVAIAGPSGCGKTTLLSILGLLDSPTGGEYRLVGQPVANLTASQRAHIRNREIGFIFQAFNLIGDLTVYENVELPLTYRNMPGAERKKRVMEALERVGMAHRTNHYPAQLSGGQQQRVMIAMAIAGKPSLLVADEPTTALDVTVKSQILQLIRDLRDKLELSILLITHDIGVAAEITDRIIVLYGGLILEEGPAAKSYGRLRSHTPLDSSAVV